MKRTLQEDEVTRPAYRWLGELYIGKRRHLAIQAMAAEPLDLPAGERQNHPGGGWGGMDVFLFYTAKSGPGLPGHGRTSMRLRRELRSLAKEEGPFNLRFVQGAWGFQATAGLT